MDSLGRLSSVIEYSSWFLRDERLDGKLDGDFSGRAKERICGIGIRIGRRVGLRLRNTEHLWLFVSCTWA